MKTSGHFCVEMQRIPRASCWPTACTRHRSLAGSAPHTGRSRALGDADTIRRRNGAEGNMQVDQLANKCLFLALSLHHLAIS